MSYELTDILNRCNRDDAMFLASLIGSNINFSDDKGLKEQIRAWQPGESMPLVLNHKLETEIRYLGSNDFAYATRKMRGKIPAGVSVDEILDDLCKLLKLEISNASTLEARLEIFAGHVVDKQFNELPDERKRQLIERLDFTEAQRRELIDKLVNKKELLLPVILNMVGRGGPQVLQSIVIAVLAPFIGTEAAKQLLAQIAARLPAASWLGPLIMAAGTGWLIVDLAGPASRKTIPLMLYLGVLCFRDGETKEFADANKYKDS